MAAVRELVTVDLGGTHARFALAQIDDNGSIQLDEPQTLHTEDHASFQTAWEDYRKRMGGTLPANVALAIAGPINGDVIRFTNNPWVIRPALVREKLGVNRYTIVNDFEAVAHAVAKLGDEHFIHLAGPDRPLSPDGTLSVIGPGTGLGVAHLWRDAEGSYRVQATEGGHVDFSPVDSIEGRNSCPLAQEPYPRFSRAHRFGARHLRDLRDTRRDGRPRHSRTGRC